MSGLGILGVIVAAIAVVGSLPLLVYAVLPIDGRDRSVPKRGRGLSPVRKNQLSHSAADRLVLPVAQRLSRLVRRVTPTGLVDSTARRLVAAGMTSRLPLEAVVALKVGSGAVLGLLALFLAPVQGALMTVLAAGVAGAIGFVMPDYQLGRAAMRRQQEIRSDLPEVLDQLTVIVEAGLGFDSAVKRVVSSTQGPLSEEFGRVLRSIRLGASRADALTALADRIDVVEVRQFVVAVRQADQLGVPIARILRTQSEHLRELTRLQAEEKAMRLPVKLTFPMVFCMLPALFVVVLGPMIVRLLGNGLG